MESVWIPLMVVFPLLTAVALNLVHGSRNVKYMIILAGLIFISLPFVIPYGYHTFGAHLREAFSLGLAPGIVYSFSSYQMVVIAVLCLIAYLVSLSHIGAFSKHSGVYLAFIFVGVASCSAVVLTDDVFHMFVFLEIAVISQAALVIATGTVESIKASLKYLIVGNVSANVILLGIALLLSMAGSLNITDIQNHLSSSKQVLATPVALLSCGMMLFGWAYASGLFPFHNIKSELYAGAEPSASGLLQTQTKFILVAFGIIILRIFGAVPHVKSIMLSISVGAMVFGVVMAMRQEDYKRLLSYHAISQAGYVASGLSLGTPLGIMAGIFHAVNNVLYKSALFIGCDLVKYRHHETDFKKLGGALTSIPLIGFLVLCAKFAISGIPPFNGFQSKLMLMKASLDVGYPEIAAIMILVSVGTFISMMKAFYLVYLNHNKDSEVKARFTPRSYIIALIVLVLLCVILGVYPDLALGFIEPIANKIGVGAAGVPM